MSSSDWLKHFLDKVQLPEFYDAFKNVLQVTQLQHFEYVHTADYQRIGLSAPAIARLKEALKDYRENAGLPRNPRKKHHLIRPFGISFLDFLRYGPPRDTPILSLHNDNTSMRRCLSDMQAPNFSGSHAPGLSPEDNLQICQLIREEDISLCDDSRGRLGSGSFGVVRRGDWRLPSGRTLPVALKILRHNKTDDAADFFATVLSEVMLMQSVYHPNLVRIYGIIPLNPLVIVTELAPLGSLLTALRQHSALFSSSSSSSPSSPPRPSTAFSVDVLWDMGIQLARGMAHLASCRLIHRDLAARNVLLFGNASSSSSSCCVTVKIGDFGLLRRSGQAGGGGDQDSLSIGGGVYVGSGRQKIPFAWSPPEAIRGHRFSQASDVWSWGVTVWEIWSGGADPWPGLNSDAVLAELKLGRRLVWPRHTCPRRLYQILLAAWRFEPERRPTFEYLKERLDKIRPAEVVATQAFDEADRMDVVSGDRILVIEGPAANFWWRGQNRRTGEIAAFPREIVRLQRHLQSQDISRPIENSFVHVGHHGFEGRAWGHVDRVEPSFLSGVRAHHADTLSQTYAPNQASTVRSASSACSTAWRPLNPDSGGASSVCGAEEVQEAWDAPRLDVYEETGEDERRLIDSTEGATVGTQKLPPPPNSAGSGGVSDKLAKDLEASLRNEYYSLSRSGIAAAGVSSLPLGTANTHQRRRRGSNSRSTAMATGGVGGGGDASTGAEWTASSSTLSGAASAPLIDFHYYQQQQKANTGGGGGGGSELEASPQKYPIPSAPIYQSQASTPPPSNPYFQAAWNAWIRQSPAPAAAAAASSPFSASPFPNTAHLSTGSSAAQGEVEGLCRLFNAANLAPRQQKCEREVLVGGAAGVPCPMANTNPFLTSPETPLFPEPVTIQSPATAHHDPTTRTVSPPPPPPDFDASELREISRRLPGGCSAAEAREALACALHSPRARLLLLHSNTSASAPSASASASDAMAPNPGGREWRVKAATRLLLLRRLMSLRLCPEADLDVAWCALERADWCVERAVNLLIYG